MAASSNGRRRRDPVWNRCRKELRLAPVGIFIAVVSLLIGALSLLFTLRTYRIIYKKPFDIAVGIAPFQATDGEQLLARTHAHFEPVNDYLRANDLKYRFHIPVNRPMTTYKELVRNLEVGGKDNIVLAYLSMGLYVDLVEDVYRPQGRSPLQCIGYKTDNDAIHYRCMLIWKRGSAVDSLFTEDRQRGAHGCWKGVNELIGSGRSVWVGDAYSVSTYLVPVTYLETKGVSIKPEHVVRGVAKTELVKRLREGSILVGFVSDVDYEKLGNDTLYLGRHEIPVPIPYDAVVVNAEWWDKVSNYDRREIKRALSVNKTMGFTDAEHDVMNEPQRRLVEQFGQYLSSAVLRHEEREGGFCAVMPLLENVRKRHWGGITSGDTVDVVRIVPTGTVHTPQLAVERAGMQMKVRRVGASELELHAMSAADSLRLLTLLEDCEGVYLQARGKSW